MFGLSSFVHLFVHLSVSPWWRRAAHRASLRRAACAACRAALPRAAPRCRVPRRAAGTPQGAARLEGLDQARHGKKTPRIVCWMIMMDLFRFLFHLNVSYVCDFTIFHLIVIFLRSSSCSVLLPVALPKAGRGSGQRRAPGQKQSTQLPGDAQA